MLSKQDYLGLLIDTALRKVKHIIALRARPHRISAQQFWVLIELAGDSGLHLTELAERHGMQMANASRVVGGLIERKLVKVQRDPADRRKGHLELTASGTALARKLQREAELLSGAAESGMNAEEAARLRALLRRMIENLDQLGGVRS